MSLGDTEYEILISKCDGEHSDHCEPQEIIDQYLLENEIEVSIFILE